MRRLAFGYKENKDSVFHSSVLEQWQQSQREAYDAGLDAALSMYGIPVEEQDRAYHHWLIDGDVYETVKWAKERIGKEAVYVQTGFIVFVTKRVRNKAGGYDPVEEITLAHFGTLWEAADKAPELYTQWTYCDDCLCTGPHIRAEYDWRWMSPMSIAMMELE